MSEATHFRFAKSDDDGSTESATGARRATEGRDGCEKSTKSGRD